MKLIGLTAIGAGSGFLLLGVAAATPQQAATTTKPAATRPAASQAARKVLDRAALEKQFEESMSNVTLDGVFQMARGDQPFSDPKPDKYMIESVHKAEADWWVFKARIDFGGNDAILPIRVRVTWAEDTPVITVDETTIPGIGTYSARVMVYRDYYAGTWFGSGYGGVMTGRVLKNPSDGK
jgi:hypothetical protein